MVLGSRNAVARRIFDDTCFAQKDKGTDTAHGTNHHAAGQNGKGKALSHMTQRGTITYIIKAVRPQTILQGKATMNLHNTNMQAPKYAKGRHRVNNKFSVNKR